MKTSNQLAPRQLTSETTASSVDNLISRKMPVNGSKVVDGVFIAPTSVQGRCKTVQGLCKAISKQLVVNSASLHGAAPLLISMASNADVPAISAEANDGWLLLAPYGDTDYWRDEKGELKRYTQRFQQDNAQKMVAAFNTMLGKKGARFRGLPIYRGHPDADPKRWPDESRLGGVMALDARTDGLYVKTAWNDAGLANLSQGYLVYPSPAWLYDMRAAKQTGRIEPDELKSVGLTNSPRIADVDAWTNSDALNSPNEENTMTLTPEAKKKIIKMFGLPENSSDAEVATAINGAPDTNVETLRTTATNAETARTTAETQVGTLTNERDTARTEATTFRRVATNALLDSAINEGRLTAAERPEFERQFATNFETASTVLSKKQPALPRQEIDVRRGADLDLSTQASRKLAWNTLTEDLMDSGKRTLDQAIHAARQDPRGKQILKAMEDADKAAASSAK